MKKLIKISLTTAILACSFNPLYAGGNHDDGHKHSQKELSKDLAQKEAYKKVQKLVDIKKIEQSWLKAPILDAKKKKFNDHFEWVVSYQNKNIKDTKKQTLYVFVNMHGKITGANYSGK